MSNFGLTFESIPRQHLSAIKKKEVQSCLWSSHRHRVEWCLSSSWQSEPLSSTAPLKPALCAFVESDRFASTIRSILWKWSSSPGESLIFTNVAMVYVWIVLSALLRIGISPRRNASFLGKWASRLSETRILKMAVSHRRNARFLFFWKWLSRLGETLIFMKLNSKKEASSDPKPFYLLY